MLIWTIWDAARMPAGTSYEGWVIEVAEGQPSQGVDPAVAQRSADRLALALEDVGFDVGRAFPMLGSGPDYLGRPGVELGHVTAAVADRLSTMLSRAAQHGVTVPTDERGS